MVIVLRSIRKVRVLTLTWVVVLYFWAGYLWLSGMSKGEQRTEPIRNRSKALSSAENVRHYVSIMRVESTRLTKCFNFIADDT